MGQDQGTESRFNLWPQEIDVSSRPKAHCDSAESALGEVEAKAKNRLTRLVVRDGTVSSCSIWAEPGLTLIKCDQ